MQSFIYKLLNYLNGSIKQDTNYHIARTLLYHIKEIENYSLEEMAQVCLVSDSTLHRFFQLIGYKNFKTLRLSLLNQEEQYYPTINNQHEKGDYLIKMNENMEMIEQVELSSLDRMIQSMWKAKQIYLLGYGDFQYPALYFQKQLFSHGILSEVVAVGEISQDWLKRIDQDSLIIVTSLRGSFLHLHDDVNNQQTLAMLPAKKILITQSQNEDWERIFDSILYCGKYNENGLGKYAIMRIYERIIFRLHETSGVHVFE